MVSSDECAFSSLYGDLLISVFNELLTRIQIQKYVLWGSMNALFTVIRKTGQEYARIMNGS